MKIYIAKKNKYIYIKYHTPFKYLCALTSDNDGHPYKTALTRTNVRSDRKGIHAF